MTTPAQLLDAAEREFRQHRFTTGADMVWDAAYRSIADAAHRANLPCRTEKEAYDAAEAMDRRHKGEPLDYWLQLRIADIYRTQAAHHGDETDWQRDPDEYVENLDGIREMAVCLSADDTANKRQLRP